MTTVLPADLGDRGRRLWIDAGADKLGALDRVLLHEICRTVDRLEHIDRILRRDVDAWFTLAAEAEGRSEVAIVVDNVLGEARHQQGRLTSMYAELRQRTAGALAAGKAPPPAAPTPEVPTGVAGIIASGRRIG